MQRNHKGRLKEWLEENNFEPAVYQANRDRHVGSDHMPAWHASVSVGGRRFATWDQSKYFGTKKAAEQYCAKLACESLFDDRTETIAAARAMVQPERARETVEYGGSRVAWSSLPSVVEPYCDFNVVCGSSEPTEKKQSFNPFRPSVIKPDDKAVVYVDADHISFVGGDVCQQFSGVAAFRFYFAEGANLPHVQRVASLSNVTLFEAPQPIKNLADVMIIIDVARQRRSIKTLIVSKDSLLYNPSLLIDNCERASTLEKMTAWLCKRENEN